MPDAAPTDNWTQYQKLVLSELERHEEKQDQLQKDLTDLRLLVANLSAVMAQNTETIKNLSHQLQTFEGKAASQASDITLLKYKIGLAASGISTLLTFVVQVGMKYLEKGN